VNEIIFLVSFLVCSLLIFRNATGFYMLILYPAMFPKVFLRSRSFLVESLGPSMYRVISSANRDYLTSSSPI
jgi:hypothetical protein